MQREQQTAHPQLTNVLCGFARLFFSPSSDAFLRSCVSSLHHFVLYVSRAAAESYQCTPLLRLLALLLSFVVHAHPFISEFGRAVWLQLHHSLDRSFHRFALETVIQLLQQTCGALDSADNANTHMLRAWSCNRAQTQLIELLAQTVPSMEKQEQVCSEASFRMRVQVRLPHLTHVAVLACVVSLSCFFFVTSMFLCCRTMRPSPHPLFHCVTQVCLCASCLHSSCAHTWSNFTWTYKRCSTRPLSRENTHHTDAAGAAAVQGLVAHVCVLPCLSSAALNELSSLRSLHRMHLASSLPLVTCTLELLTGALATVPSVHAGSVQTLLQGVQQQLVPVTVALCSALAHASPPVPPLAQYSTVQALLRLAQQELVQQRMHHTHWATILHTLLQQATSAPVLRFALAEALMAFGTVTVPSEAEQSFWLRALQPTCAFLLSPAPASAATEAVAAAATLFPFSPSFLASAATPLPAAVALEESSRWAFFVFSSHTPVTAWTPKLKDLIPAQGREAVLVYVRQHLTQDVQHKEAAAGATSGGHSSDALFRGRTGTRTELAANPLRLAGDAWQRALAVECAALSEQCQAADAQLQCDASASERRAALAAAHLPVLEHGNSLLWPHDAEAQQEAPQQ